MKFSTPKTLSPAILAFSAALTFGGGALVYAGEKTTADKQAQTDKESKAKRAITMKKGEKLNGHYKVTDLDMDQHMLKSYLGKADVTVIGFLDVEGVLVHAVHEKDEWINERAQSNLTPRLHELKMVMKNEAITSAKRSVNYVLVLLTADDFAADKPRTNVDERKLGNIIETYFDEQGMDEVQIVTTRRSAGQEAFGLKKGQLATAIVQRHHVEYVRFCESKSTPTPIEGHGAKADAKRLKAKEEAKPKEGAKADAKRLKAKEADSLFVALKRIVETKRSVPASAQREEAAERAKEAVEDAEDKVEKAQEKAEKTE